MITLALFLGVAAVAKATDDYGVDMGCLPTVTVILDFILIFTAIIAWAQP